MEATCPVCPAADNKSLQVLCEIALMYEAFLIAAITEHPDLVEKLLASNAVELEIASKVVTRFQLPEQC